MNLWSNDSNGWFDRSSKSIIDNLVCIKHVDLLINFEEEWSGPLCSRDRFTLSTIVESILELSKLIIPAIPHIYLTLM